MLLLVKRICQEQQRPVHEVLSWPYDEILWWQVFYSIDKNGDEPIITKNKKNISEESSIAALKGIFK